MRQFPLILLAEGHSNWNGASRGLIEYNGRPFILHQLKRFAAARGHRAVVVIGRHHEAYRRALPWTESARDGTVEVEGLHVMTVLDEHPEQGMLEAIQAGARVLIEEKFAGAFVQPIEVPPAASEVWSHLRNIMTANINFCVPEYMGRRGYPLLLSHRYLETLLEMPAQTTLDVQMQVLPPGQLRRLSVDDPTVCMTLGSSAQWNRFVGRGESY